MSQPCLLFYAVMFLFVLKGYAQNQPAVATYRNPVIAGDLPDPSVIKVGEMYYAAGTTSDFVPHYPLYQSEDLVNWNKVGAIFSETPSWAGSSFWAPELFYKDGTYFVYYTAKRKSDGVSCIGVATTQDVSKGFTDQGIVVEWGNEAIDAYVFEDTDGKLYMTWKAYGLDPDRPIEILGSELSPDGLSLLGEAFSLTRHDKGWKGNGDEGQCLIKHGSYYYLFYSTGGCCDNRCDYEVHVARSKDLKHGWEQFPEALLQGGEQWVCPGHGTLVQTDQKQYFYLYHAYQAEDFEYVGRQGMLDEVVWDEKMQWPFFRYGHVPTAQARVPQGSAAQQRMSLFEDRFTAPDTLGYWQWDLKQPKPLAERRNNTLILSSQNAELTFLGISPGAGTYTMEAGLQAGQSGTHGLCIYGDTANLLAFTVNHDSLRLYEIREGKTKQLARQSLPQHSQLYLKAEAVNGQYFQFLWSADQQTWHAMLDENGVVNAVGLPRWGVAMRAGLMAVQAPAVFTYFRLHNHF